MRLSTFSVFACVVTFFVMGLLAFFMWQSKSFALPRSSTFSLEIRGVSVFAEVANTPAERARGLSGRASLAENEGMFFIMESSDRHGIWMKDMQFPIDIIWISKERRVVDFAARVKPDTFPTVFTPRADARFVLEVPAGFVETHAVAIGDAVSFQ